MLTLLFPWQLSTLPFEKLDKIVGCDENDSTRVVS